MTLINFRVRRADAVVDHPLAVGRLVIAGWTGRDKAAVEHHIRELEALGVRPPDSTPVYYPVAAARLSLANRIEVTAEDSSGEVEFVLIVEGRALYVGVGSDHTDRQVETYDVTVSKQVCEKPIAPEIWAFEDVRAHWDQLMLRSWIVEGGRRVLYQEGPVSNMLPPQVLLAGSGLAHDPAPAVLYCGTLPAIGGIRPAQSFEFELEDPILGRRITHGYVASPLRRSFPAAREGAAS